MKIKTLVAAALGVGLMLAAGPASFAGSGECGGASWYNLPGNKTASGARMNPQAMTAAHKSLPFGTRVRVTNQNNGKSIIVTINDRGPFIRGRILDLTPVGANKLGFRNAGHTKVCISRV